VPENAIQSSFWLPVVHMLYSKGRPVAVQKPHLVFHVRRAPTYEEVSGLQFLDAVLKESLRVTPIVTILFR
jgi:cytochrome P450